MNENLQYDVSAANVVHDVLDGEVIMINLDNGYYYSIDKVGADIWEMVNKQSTLGSMIDTLCSQHSGDRDFVAHSVLQFLTKLEAEGLVVRLGAAPETANGIENVRYRVNEPQILSDTLKDDVVLINQENNRHYSIEGTGVEIWQMLTAGHTAAEIVADLSGRYSADPHAIEESVSNLVGRLVGEDLVVPSPSATAPAGWAAASEPASAELPPFPAPKFNQYTDLGLSIHAPAASEQFRPPTLERYTDMEDLLLLDPIHEVAQEEGWPHRPQGV